MDAGYAAGYRDLYRRHWWWRAREAVILRELRNILAEGGHARILDVGCGDGLFFDRLRSFGEIEGVEPDSSMLDPRGPWRHVIHAGPFDETFQPSHRYDVILMMDVLEHMNRPDRAVQLVRRLLEPGGHLLATVPAFAWLWTRHDDLNHHVRRYNRAELRKLFRDAGLAIERERFLFQWIVPAKLMVRTWERVHRSPPGPPSVPFAPLNSLLWALTRAELAVATRISMPFGGSLLMIGRA